MMPRLSSEMLVGALIRRVEAAGGHAMVLARGDRGAGTILILCAERGRPNALLERTLAMDGGYTLMPCGPADPTDSAALSEYLARRRARDPDLWVVELDIAAAERFAAETIGNA
jgi:hypothetical protein